MPEAQQSCEDASILWALICAAATSSFLLLVGMPLLLVACFVATGSHEVMRVFFDVAGHARTDRPSMPLVQLVYGCQDLRVYGIRINIVKSTQNPSMQLPFNNWITLRRNRLPRTNHHSKAEHGQAVRLCPEADCVPAMALHSTRFRHMLTEMPR